MHQIKYDLGMILLTIPNKMKVSPSRNISALVLILSVVPFVASPYFHVITDFSHKPINKILRSLNLFIVAYL